MPSPDPDVEKHEGPLSKALGLIRASAAGKARKDNLSVGELARLRRGGEGAIVEPALWRVLANIFPNELQEGWLRERLPDWACALAAFAELPHESSGRKMSLGEALGVTGFSELRLTRLLRSSAPALYREVRGAAHVLAQKAAPVDPIQLGLLVVGEPGEKADHLRRRIAQSYYRALHKKSEVAPTSPKES
ncbi:MAG: type I-E CRISPR-associated protein Cse2/CasB [Deltaproteobacteria bacterium]